MKKFLSIALLCSSVLAITSLSPMNAKASEKSNVVSQSTTGINKSPDSLISIGKFLNGRTVNINAFYGGHIFWDINNPNDAYSVILSDATFEGLADWTLYYDETMDAYQIVCGPKGSNSGWQRLGVLGEDKNGKVTAHANNGIEAEYWKLLIEYPNIDGYYVLKNVKTGKYLAQRTDGKLGLNNVIIPQSHFILEDAK